MPLWHGLVIGTGSVVCYFFWTFWWLSIISIMVHICVKLLGDVIQRFRLSCYQYANDAQLYHALPAYLKEGMEIMNSAWLQFWIERGFLIIFFLTLQPGGMDMGSPRKRCPCPFLLAAQSGDREEASPGKIHPTLLFSVHAPRRGDYLERDFPSLFILAMLPGELVCTRQHADGLVRLCYFRFFSEAHLNRAA